MAGARKQPAELVAMRRAARAVSAVRKASGGVTTRLQRASFPYRRPTVPGGVEPLPERRHTGADFETDWARTLPARMTRTLIVEGPLKAAISVVANPERRGLDRIEDLADASRDADPAHPVIFAANHHSHLDAPLMLTSIPEPWRHRVVVAAAADYFFGTRAGASISALCLSAIPIERDKVDRRSLHFAESLIRDGWSMVIFPEGGRSPDGWGQPFRGGAAFLAQRCEVPVVPVHLEGTGSLWAKGSKLPKRGLTTVTFGHPIPHDAARDTRGLNAVVEKAVAELADEASSDWWAARQRAGRGATPSLGGPGGPSWRRAWALGDRSPRRRRKPTWPDLA